MRLWAIGIKANTVGFLVIMPILCTGCAPHHKALSEQTPTNIDYHLSLSTLPTALRQLDPTQITVQATDKASKPVTGARVTVQLAMPTMDMGRNEVAMHEVATPPGTYIGNGRFTMPGDWQAAIQLDKTGQHTEKSVSLTVK